jgi:hypothetical protein
MSALYSLKLCTLAIRAIQLCVSILRLSLTNMHNFNQSMKRRVDSTCALLLQPRFLKGRSADSIGYSNYFDVTHTNLTAFQKSS